MQDFAPLSYTDLKEYDWQRASNWSFAQPLGIVPLAAQELRRATGQLPMGFVRRGDTHLLVAVLGIPEYSVAVTPGGHWQPGHFPDYLRTYPFRLLNVGQDRQTVGMAKECLVPAGTGEGSALFNDQGRPAETVKPALDFMKRLAASMVATRKAIGMLDEHQLLTSWTPSVTLSEETVRLDGLYRIDNERLRALDGQVLKVLQDNGALDIAYAQLLSMDQIKRLGQWAGNAAATEVPESFDTLFGDDNDEFSFDFDS